MNDHRTKTLREFYRIGQRSLSTHTDRMEYGGTGAEAKRFRLSQEYLRKARAFAENYSQREFAALIALTQKHRCPVGVGHVFHLLTVPRPQRNTLQRLAIKDRWSVRRLQTEIRKVQRPEKTYAGRGARAPADAAEAIDEFRRLCLHWQRYIEAVMPGGEPGVRLPRNIMQRLRTAATAIRSLGDMRSGK